MIYEQESNFTVTIPKKIALGSDKSAEYSVTVSGSVGAGESVSVVPDSEFIMNETGSRKSSVKGVATQDDTVWDYEQIEAGNAKNGNVTVSGLTAGEWSGSLRFNINLDVHTHSYVEHITKQATCTEDGLKTFTCKCGDSYTEVIQATGHDYDEPTYLWNNLQCIATRICKNDDCYVDTEHATITNVVKTAATCTNKGTHTYTATFKNSAFATQTKDVHDIAALGHTAGSDGRCVRCGLEQYTTTYVDTAETWHNQTFSFYEMKMTSTSTLGRLRGFNYGGAFYYIDSVISRSSDMADWYVFNNRPYYDTSSCNVSLIGATERSVNGHRIFTIIFNDDTSEKTITVLLKKQVQNF